MKYSVVIPAYNAEKTIGRCLDSLLACQYADTEIIIINDGSCDGTDTVCRTYADKNNQIRYFCKDNGGVSSARNLGLSHAQGIYVTFVDSDDFISPDYFTVLDRYLSEECDFLMFGRSVFDGRTLRDFPFYDDEALNAADTAALVSRALIRQQLNTPVNKVFRRKLIDDHNIRFDERLPIGEDKVFVVQYLIHARNAVFIRDSLYTVSVENENSLSRKKRENLCEHILLEHELLFRAVEDSAYHAELKKAVSYSYYRSAYTVIRELQKFDLPYTQRKARTLEICHRYAARRNCSYCGLTHWLMALPIRLKMAGLIDIALRKKIM